MDLPLETNPTTAPTLPEKGPLMPFISFPIVVDFFVFQEKDNFYQLKSAQHMFQKRNLSVNFYVFVRKFLEVHGPGVHRNLLQTSQTPPGTCVSDIVSIFLQ